jgi:cytochrome c-type biogenesis protein CcmH/NrfF
VTMNRWRWAVVVTVAAAPLALKPANAHIADRSSASQKTLPVTDSAIEAQTTAIAATLRCPVCQGESIQDSPSDLAQSMRNVVRDRVRAGESPEEIKAYFASKYGEWILLEPKMTGLNVLLYVLPVILILGGLALVFVLVRRWTSPSEKTIEHGSD